MEKLLYLVHRIPYPPNKGDKIRSFHWLKGLSEKYRIYLGAFIDDEKDRQYIDKLDEFCEETFLPDLRPGSAKLKSLSGLLTGKPLTLPYYFNTSMQNWVAATIQKQGIQKILIYSSSMAQYVEQTRYQHLQRVIDFVDMDSDKWRQYAESKTIPANWIYAREAKKLAGYENEMANKLNASLFVSQSEAHSFAAQLDKPQARVDYVNNGVDTDYFSPQREYANPFTDNGPAVVFTGAMDYWANVDAVKWFADEVFPRIREHDEQVRFYIVGSRPSAEVLSLAQQDGIVVTGRVEDVRPYLAHCDVSVAPMRIARGIQNKVLEAMAMARPVIATPQAFEGIEVQPGREIFVCDDPAAFANKVIETLDGGDDSLGLRARQCVQQRYSWDANLEKLVSFLEQ